MGNKVLALLEAADWNDIIEKLTRYAIWRAWRYKWKSGSPAQLPGGKTPEDIACSAIEKVWSGIRNWDPDKYPNLLKHLMWIVDSDMEHLVSSIEHKKIYKIPEPKEENEMGSPLGKTPEALSPIQISGRILTPEEKIIANEDEIFEQGLISALHNAVKGDVDLELLLYCFEEGLDKPEDIAAQTGWDVSKVYALKKKLARKGVKVRSTLLKGK